LTVLDIVLIGVVGACAIYGACQGIIREASHVAAFILGIFLASRLHSTAAQLLLYRLPSSTAHVAAFVGLVVLVVAAVYVVAGYMKSAADKLKLGSVDHAAGAVFGAVEGGLVCAIILFALVNFSSSLPSSYLERSRVASFLLDRSSALSRFLPGDSLSKIVPLFEKGVHLPGEAAGRTDVSGRQEAQRPGLVHPLVSRPGADCPAARAGSGR
jgi:membrane protein required for colicin V production